MLVEKKVAFVCKGYKFACEGSQTGLEIEVCRIKGTNMHALELKRVRGSSLGYKNLCRELIANWKL